jgi:hypothetical protein
MVRWERIEWDMIPVVPAHPAFVSQQTHAYMQETNMYYKKVKHTPDSIPLYVK